MTEDTTPPARRGRPRSAPRHEATASEIRVLRDLAAGYRSSEIADRLGMTRSGVSMQIMRGRKALGARSKEQAIYIASILGLLEGVPRP